MAGRNSFPLKLYPLWNSSRMLLSGASSVSYSNDSLVQIGIESIPDGRLDRFKSDPFQCLDQALVNQFHALAIAYVGRFGLQRAFKVVRTGRISRTTSVPAY